MSYNGELPSTHHRGEYSEPLAYRSTDGFYPGEEVGGFAASFENIGLEGVALINFLFNQMEAKGRAAEAQLNDFENRYRHLL